MNEIVIGPTGFSSTVYRPWRRLQRNCETLAMGRTEVGRFNPPILVANFDQQYNICVFLFELDHLIKRHSLYGQSLSKEYDPYRLLQWGTGESRRSNHAGTLSGFLYFFFPGQWAPCPKI